MKLSSSGAGSLFSSCFTEGLGGRGATSGGGAAGCGDQGQYRLPRVPQVTDDQLSLELKAGNKEKDCEQAVARPGMEWQIEVREVRPDLVSR